MTVSKFQLCSQASVLVGGRTISSFADGTNESTVAGELYEAIAVECCSLYRWRFATRQAQLSRRSAAPDARWDAAYELPADVQLVNALTVRDNLIEFDRYENSILCDAGVDDIVIADVTERVHESYWPGYFQALVRLKLASVFAVPIAEDAPKGSVYEGMFMRQFGLAKTADAQGRTARKMPVGRFAAVHRGKP